MFLRHVSEAEFFHRTVQKIGFNINSARWDQPVISTLLGVHLAQFMLERVLRTPVTDTVMTTWSTSSTVRDWVQHAFPAQPCVCRVALAIRHHGGVGGEMQWRAKLQLSEPASAFPARPLHPGVNAAQHSEKCTKDSVNRSINLNPPSVGNPPCRKIRSTCDRSTRRQSRPCNMAGRANIRMSMPPYKQRDLVE